MSNSETNETMENSLQTVLNALDGIRRTDNLFWNTPVDFKITTFPMHIYQDQLMWWAEVFGEKYGHKL